MLATRHFVYDGLRTVLKPPGSVRNGTRGSVWCHPVSPEPVRVTHGLPLPDQPEGDELTSDLTIRYCSATRRVSEVAFGPVTRPRHSAHATDGFKVSPGSPICVSTKGPETSWRLKWLSTTG